MLAKVTGLPSGRCSFDLLGFGTCQPSHDASIGVCEGVSFTACPWIDGASVTVDGLVDGETAWGDVRGCHPRTSPQAVSESGVLRQFCLTPSGRQAELSEHATFLWDTLRSLRACKGLDEAKLQVTDVILHFTDQDDVGAGAHVKVADFLPDPFTHRLLQSRDVAVCHPYRYEDMSAHGL